MSFWDLSTQVQHLGHVGSVMTKDIFYFVKMTAAKICNYIKMYGTVEI